MSLGAPRSPPRPSLVLPYRRPARTNDDGRNQRGATGAGRGSCGRS
jgi:hypothetical protein